jgi:hypothetical protein
MATATARGKGYESDSLLDDTASRASGWIGFAAITLGLAGGWNVFDGILAISRSKVYTANATYVFSDLRTWGWIVLIVGVLEVLAAFALLGGSSMARWFGIGVAGLNSIVQLMFVPAAPFWAIAMFTLDMLVIYALAVYGGKDVEPA